MGNSIGVVMSCPSRMVQKYHFDVSPDGTRIAILKDFSQGPIRILSLKGQVQQEVTLKGWSFGGGGFDWASDGQGFFVSSPIPRGSNLLHVDLRGNVHPLWEQMGNLGSFGISSPDSRHIATHSGTTDSKIWMMEGFGETSPQPLRKLRLNVLRKLGVVV